ncbi:ATP-dependent exoDNAse (exonuclease V) beta subunit (contains helicase and exonuclease domains) [Daejeonella rubra]|uniref:DNA 3'-5' helicase n=1 Tax=Daejeonella rubra TaxID=990371 RepID=A0A1G9R9X3_9SPHI|nr:UvrD-helicase domain-containing protein [Daejeonella rubra]SDM20043.1 ATP-dependent exoDNAse (exonuclease V) beta subunit (contains helicase and exonuclease domains) [Daejeonella rubra]
MPQQKALKLVRASAGSGKTFALTAHYLTLLFSGKGKYREILAVTFTNKATAEMKERILGALEELALSGFEKSKFSSILQDNFPGISDLEMRAKASEIYSSILHDYSRFSVSTIDGFVQQLIRSFAFELNLDSGYKLEMNQDKVKEELVAALNLRLEKDPDLLEWVTSLAIERISDGKDWDYQKSLKDLANEIFKERYYPFQEAMLAMGDDQGKEFNALRAEVNKGITSFKKDIIEKAAIIKELFDASGVEKGMLDQQSRNPLFKLDKIVAEDFAQINSFEKYLDNFDQWPHKSLKDASAVMHLFIAINPLLKTLFDAYNNGAAMFETYRAIAKNSAYLRLMQGMADLLKNYRSENKTLLISDAQQLLRGITGSDVDNPSFIWEKTGNKFKHFLFDEFQDTSSFQWMNFLPLVKNAIAEGSPGVQASHLVVGDVKQSIYRWRNGDWRILHSNLKHDLLTDNVKEEELSFNRRSSENVIRFNNFLYQKLPSILQNQLNGIFADSGLSYLQEFWDKRNSDLIVKAYEGSSQKITESTLPGGKIEIKFFYKGEEPEEDDVNPLAATYAIERIIELLNQGFFMKDIGILVRKNSEAVQILDCIFQKSNYDKLTAAAGKTFQVISGEALKIMNNPAVQLLLSTFRLLSVHEPESGIYKAECARLWYQVRNPGQEQVRINSEDWIGFSFKPVSALTDVLPAEFCAGFNSYRQLPVNELAEKLIRIYQLGTVQSENHIPFLLAFRDQLAVFSSAGDQGIAAFIDWWDNEGSAKALPSSENQDAVQVMTVHKSKGLEFRAVIVPFMDWKLNQSSTGAIKKLLWVNAEAAGFGNFKSFPVDYSKNLASTVFAGDYFEEMLLNYMDELNALYVASTRAKDYLCIICPKTPVRKTDSKGPPNEIQVILSELFQSHETADPELVFEDNQYSFGEIPVHAVEKDPLADHGQLIIHDYHVNEQLTERFKRNSMNEDTWFNAKQRKGIVLHKVLETLTGTGDLDKLIAEKVQDGLIREAEKEEIRQAVSDVLMQDEIKEWFDKAKSIISEKDMIIDSGVVKRPDKLFILDDRAILLDFKFGEQNNKYIADISLYRDNLIKMGEFEQVDAYLWYAQDRKLQKV